jgi:hypothetical protein
MQANGKDFPQAFDAAKDKLRLREPQFKISGVEVSLGPRRGGAQLRISGAVWRALGAVPGKPAAATVERCTRYICASSWQGRFQTL